MNQGTMGMYAGLKIITDIYLTEEWNQCHHLTWRERLTSWPWRPWIKERVEIIRLPSESFYLLQKQNMVVCHPEMEIRFKDAMRGLG